MTERIVTPHDVVTGVLDNPDDLDTVDRALQSAGFSKDALTFAGGEQAIETIDPEGRHHGLRGRITRSLQHFGGEGDEHLAAVAEVQAGHWLVIVSVSGEDQKNLAASTLRRLGVRRLRYWGEMAIEELSP